MRIFQALAVATTIAIVPSVFAADNPAKRLTEAATVLHEMTKIDDKGVPQDLIDHAQCVAVIPNLKKAGFIVGGKYGAGFLMCRRGGGLGWSAPAAIKIEGGSVGFQIGASEQDVILIVKNKSGQEKLMADKFTIGANATAAAGPVGRDLSAQTDAQMHAEILTYSRARGLFAGLSLEGATLRPDSDANLELYGSALTNHDIIEGKVKAPAAAAGLEHALDRESMHKEG